LIGPHGREAVEAVFAPGVAAFSIVASDISFLTLTPITDLAAAVVAA